MMFHFPFEAGPGCYKTDAERAEKGLPPCTFTEEWDTVGVYGEKRGAGTHGGIDIGAIPGTPVLAIAKGEVTRLVFDHPSAGTYLEVAHPGGHWARYLHLREVLVGKGDKVKAKQRIALSGGVRGEYGAGNTYSPHLHLELWTADPTLRWGQWEYRVDPAAYLRKPSGGGGGQAKWVAISLGLAASIIALGWWMRRG